MKVLLTGANGQLGRCFIDLFPNSWELIKTDRNILDITNLSSVDDFIAKHKPNAIVNAAAYTAVDKAETEIELANQINTLAPEQLAIAAHKNNAKFIHISTDYVFDGCKNSPYLETDTTNPINVYGLTKRNGEIAVFKANPHAVIIRTSWVFSEYGNNFVKTMLKLASIKTELSIINDQIGCPTYAGDIAKTIIEILNQSVEGGIYHYCGNKSVSWFEFATTIFKVADKFNLLTQHPNLKAITTNEYPTPAKRPIYSILNVEKIKLLGIKTSNWESTLNSIIPFIYGDYYNQATNLILF